MHGEIRREIHVGITNTLERLGADCRRPANHHSRAGKLAFGDLPLIVLRVVFLLRGPTVLTGVLKDFAELGLVGADRSAGFVIGQLTTANEVTDVDLTGGRKL